MAKYCSNCGKELDDNADICLECGILVNKNNNVNCNNNVVNNKKKDMPVWAIVLIVIGCIVFIPLLFIIIIFIFAIRFTYDKGDEYLEKVGDYASDFFEEYEMSSEGIIGDTLIIDDIEFTLNGFSRYDFVGNNVAQDGNEYLVFDLDIYNTSDVEKVITYMGFSGYYDDVKCDSVFLPEEADGFNDLYMKLKPYRKSKINIVFEVPKSFENFDLNYTNILSFESITFYVTNEESNYGNDV